MGGYGSTRWGWHRKKTAIEDCLALETTSLLREGLLKREKDVSGVFDWRSRKSSVGFSLLWRHDKPLLRLRYTAIGESVDTVYPMIATDPHFGGVRWWFVCPLIVNGQACRRRVGKLYLPPRGKYFGCRHCYGLSYRSRQEYDKRVAFYRKHPASIKAELLRVKLAGELLPPHKILLFTKAIDGGVNWQNQTKPDN